MAKMRLNKQVNITKVVRKLVYTILALYVGGTIMTVFGTVMANTTSGFYNGLSLIGWTVGAPSTNGTANWHVGCGLAVEPTLNSGVTNCITATASGGVLGVIGIIGVASVVLEFITFK